MEVAFEYKFIEIIVLFFSTIPDMAKMGEDNAVIDSLSLKSNISRSLKYRKGSLITEVF